MMEEKKPVIAIDFDGTIVTHEYPEVGEPIPGALGTMTLLQQAGNRLILLTMRSGEYLAEAVNHVENAGIKLFGVNYNPEQHAWTESPKVYANLYIDDAALGCPLKRSEFIARPYVDWVAVRAYLRIAGYLPEN